MTNMIVEAVLIAFFVGGAVGAVITMQLLLGARKAGNEVNAHHDHHRRS